jgi:hypothetical protein
MMLKPLPPMAQFSPSIHASFYNGKWNLYPGKQKKSRNTEKRRWKLFTGCRAKQEPVKKYLN